MKKDPLRQTVVFSWYLLAVTVPAGLSLEALHALKVDVYLGSAMRRELWTLAHAHGGMLGVLCLASASAAKSFSFSGDALRQALRALRLGAVAMPLGFFFGGVLNSEGDPSLGILLVPLGGVCLLWALGRAALAARADPGGSTPS